MTGLYWSTELQSSCKHSHRSNQMHFLTPAFTLLSVFVVFISILRGKRAAYIYIFIQTPLRSVRFVRLGLQHLTLGHKLLSLLIKVFCKVYCLENVSVFISLRYFHNIVVCFIKSIKMWQCLVYHLINVFLFFWDNFALALYIYLKQRHVCYYYFKYLIGPITWFGRHFFPIGSTYYFSLSQC